MKRYVPILAAFLPLAASAVPEGTPVYYQRGFTPVQPTQTVSGNTIVGQRKITYEVPRQPDQWMPGNMAGMPGTMTPAGIAFAKHPDWILSADYRRSYSTFEFETGVQSVLKWNDMIFNEIGVRLHHNFNIRDYNLFAFGEYRYGQLESGGMSIDYDLKPFDNSRPDVGIFTISVGDMSGKTDNIKFGFGAKNVWDVAGWKLSPSIGYEVFRHNLRMGNHIYPNPAIYLPLLTDQGFYVFGNNSGEFFAVVPGTPPPADMYQVCMSPQDIKLVTNSPGPGGSLGNTLIIGDLVVTDPNQVTVWGVYPDECVIIGGDGMIKIPGTTHIYNTTWSGLYLGLEVEKQMTFADRLRFYVQVGMPNYSAEGIWPNRTDWQQNPSFTDKGSNGAYSYLLEMEYTHQLSERVQLSLKADTNYFHVGQIGGHLYVAGYSYWLMEDGQFVLDVNGHPQLITVEPHTVYIRDSLKYAKWQSFGLHVGIKYSF
ncbi:MAG: hypothetical protein FWF34_00320 [Alphaproteobacteria bacterium]|nr:hypothetical protein [Alphaproteobacteria bacterium]MCL2889692.1 hypothetical protein [Alphaproteobacteria bacterium]